MKFLIPQTNPNRLLHLLSSINRRNFSTSPHQPPLAHRPPQQVIRSHPPPPPLQPPSGSKLLPLTILLLGGGGTGLLAYYYYVNPNAEVFKQARGLLGVNLAEEKKKKPSAMDAEKKSVDKKVVINKPVVEQQTKKPEQQRPVITQSAPVPQPPLQKPPPTTPSIPVSAVAASAMMNSTAPSSAQQQQQADVSGPTPESVPKHVLIMALRAQQEALSESHDAKVKTIQSEYDRRLSNAVQIVEAERVVELRGKYEKASAALEAIEKGIEARTTQNERAKRLRSLWAQVNALHARVNHPEYHSSTVTNIDKPALLRSVQQVPDKFVSQMVESLPAKPVHSLESLKNRFYNDVEPVAKSVGLIRDGEGFSLWKYALGRVFSGGVVEVVRMEEKPTKSSTPPSTSPVQSTAEALDSARRHLDKSDLLSAAISVNRLNGLPRQVASDWLADARTLLETNQTLFVLMTYAASNNVF